MSGSEVKQVIVLRKDLNMRKGKMVAQGAHASMAPLLNSGGVVPATNTAYDFFAIPMTYEVEQWLTGRFTKICVSVNSEEELLDVYKKAEDAGLLCALITDAGLTEFDGVPTNTAVAIGPAMPEDVDPITGHLKLL